MKFPLFENAWLEQHFQQHSNVSYTDAAVVIPQEQLNNITTFHGHILF